MLGLGAGTTAYHNGIYGPYNTTTNTNALHFDGSGDYVDIADDDTLSFTGAGSDDDTPFSIAFWLKRDAVFASNDGIVEKGDENLGKLEYRIFFISGTVYIDISDGGITNSSYRRASWVANSTSWQHMVLTYNGDVGNDEGIAFQLYINGVNAGYPTATGGSDEEGMTNYNGALRLGALRNTIYQLGGEMCQYIMWSKVLTQTEVTYLYAGGAAHRNPLLSSQDYSSNNEVVVWLPLDTDLNDYSVNSNNGTAFGDAALSADTVPF
jgi:hypothetical protein